MVDFKNKNITLTEHDLDEIADICFDKKSVYAFITAGLAGTMYYIHSKGGPNSALELGIMLGSTLGTLVLTASIVGTTNTYYDAYVKRHPIKSRKNALLKENLKKAIRVYQITNPNAVLEEEKVEAPTMPAIESENIIHNDDKKLEAPTMPNTNTEYTIADNGKESVKN